MKKVLQTNQNPLYYFTLIFIFLLSFNSFGQEDFTEYKGSVTDIETKKPLVFVDLVIKGTNISTITNSEGEFLLKVPNSIENKIVEVTHLGYETLEVLLSDYQNRKMKLALEPSVTALPEVEINVPKDARALVKKALENIGSNYFDEDAIMTAFYRETIRKRRKNASLSEAVVEVYKQPYTSNKPDAVKLIKSRKNTNYNRLDTIALKLQGGPFSTLYSDLMKYSEYIFANNNLEYYEFTFDKSTQINNRQVFVVNFRQKPEVDIPLYYGKLFIDAQNYAITSAMYNLNVEDAEKASKMFIRKKPNRVKVLPTEAAYRVNYRTKNGKWYYAYSNILLTFEVDWKGKWFNSIYTLQSEMAITDWEKNTTGVKKPKGALKPSVIFADEASGFSDPEFWGEFNIIEPEKSIESAIKKISRQVKREKS